MTTPDPDIDYLSPTFDPASLTVPRLRAILVAHDVAYPASAKKSQLVELFNEQIAPQAKRILAARSRIKRSTRGIKDVPSSQESTGEGEESDVLPLVSPPPPSTAKRASSRRATRAYSEDTVDSVVATPAPASKRASSKTSTRASSRPLRLSEVEAEVEERPTARKTRRSATPAVKREDPEPETWDTADIESPFTFDNPFQSGSSPLTEATVTRDRRRKTLAPVEHKEKRKSSSSRRRTENYKVEEEEDDFPTSRTYEIPVSLLKRETPVPEDPMEPGEEFTAEEQLELVRERAKNGEMDILPPRRRKPVKKSSGATKAAPWTVLLALLGGVATVWRQEKLEVGYCGVGRPSVALGGVEIPEWADIIRPQCELCPQHAYCYSKLKTECEPDFILTPHPLSVGGLIPLPPTCEPDSEKARRVKAVADRVVEELRDRKAKVECGELVNDEGKPVTDPEITEQELKETMSARKRKGMSEEEFEDLWKSAIGEIVDREEVISTVEENTHTRRLSSTSLARIPLSCAIRRSIRLTLARHFWKLVGILFFILSGGYTRWTIGFNRQTEAKAKQLASTALDRLALQAALHTQDERAFPERWISMSQLRDDILRDEFSASRRQKIWEKVQKKVEQNSNVRPMVREGRSGDVSRVWEWVGAVAALDDGRTSSRRGSSRFSLGPGVDSSPTRGREDVKEMRHWEDSSRPIY